MKTKNWILKVVIPLVAIICALAFTPWDILWVWAEPLPDTVQEQVESATTHGLDGIIVYIDKKGSEPQFYSAGWKNRENKIPADPHALFKIASISKLYMAVATAKLVNDKSLSLDKTLAKYLSELVEKVENADKITLLLLAEHLNGNPDFIDSPDMSWSKLPTDINDFLKCELNKATLFSPETCILGPEKREKQPARRLRKGVLREE